MSGNTTGTYDHYLVDGSSALAPDYWAENPILDQPDAEVLDFGRKPAEIEITDDMRRMLPPGAIGRIIGAAEDADESAKSKAALQVRLALGLMGTGANYARAYAQPQTIRPPYTHMQHS